VLDGGVIAPLDYGLFGQIDARTRERIADLLLGLIAVDTDRVLRALDALDVRGTSPVADPKALARDVGELVSAYSDLTLDTIDLGQLLHELVDLIRSHRLRIPPDLVLLIRALVTIESVGRRLDPHFDIAGHLQPFLRDLAFRRFHPMRLLHQGVRTAEDLQQIATVLPDLLGQSLESFRRGELHVKFDVQHFEKLVAQLTHASHTLTGGIIISGLLVGSSLIVRSGVGPVQLGYGGYILAAVLGFWLIIGFLRGK
jgi:ubiquinone biosynthesis protein